MPSPRGPGPSPDMSKEPVRPSRRGRWLLAFVLVLAAGVIVSALPGRGKYSDDYAASLIDPVSGQPVWPKSLLDLVDHFGRPLHLMLTPVLQTVLWHHDWAYHLLNGLAHLICVVLLACLLRSLGASWPATLSGLVVFCFFPFHHEVVFWSMSLVIAIATALLLASLLVFVRFAGQDRGAWGLLGVLVLLVFAIPCFYEQPSGALGVLPLLFLVVTPRPVRWGRALTRMGLACIAAWAATLLYVGLKVGTAPPHARGAAGTLVDPEDLAGRIVATHTQAWRWLVAYLDRAFPGALETGLAKLGDPTTLVGIVAALVVFAVCLCAEIRSTTTDAHPARAWRSILLVVAGLGMISLALLPYALVRTTALAPRTWYLPSLGAGVLVAGLIDPALVWASRFGILRHARLGVLTIAGLGALAGSLAQIGYGEAMRRQSQADLRQSACLAAMLDDPPAWTVLVPMHSAFRTMRTGADIFDAGLISWHRVVWAIRSLMRFQMHRTDIQAIPWDPWHRAGPMRDVDTGGWSYPGWLSPYPATPDRLSRVSWANTIPFTIDADGGVHLVDEIILERPDGRDERIELGHVRTYASTGSRFTPFVYRPWHGVQPNPDRSHAVSRWRLTTGPRPRDDARIGSLRLWRQTYECIRLDLSPRTRAPCAIATRLRPTTHPRELVLRATVPPGHLDSLDAVAPIALRVRLEGRRHALAALMLDARTLRSERRWMPLVVRIPPIDSPRRLIVEVVGERQERPVPVFVTRGWLRPESAP